MSMEARMSLSTVSQEYLFCACAALGQNGPLRRDAVFAVSENWEHLHVCIYMCMCVCVCVCAHVCMRKSSPQQQILHTEH